MTTPYRMPNSPYLPTTRETLLTATPVSRLLIMKVVTVRRYSLTSHFLRLTAENTNRWYCMNRKRRPEKVSFFFVIILSSASTTGGTSTRLSPRTATVSSTWPYASVISRRSVTLRLWSVVRSRPVGLDIRSVRWRWRSRSVMTRWPG